MAFGILETRNPSVPGTENVYEKDNVITELSSRLKKKGDIILVPQPTDDPNDPLNWPLWKRDCILGVLCLFSLIASTLSPLLAANTVTLARDLSKYFTDVALLTGYHLLAVGVSGFLFVASARMYGKRHLYILGCILIIGSSAWGAFCRPGTSAGSKDRSYKWLIVVRVLQGVGLAPFEALVNASVGDMYFVHERGFRMAISNMSLFGGAFFTPIIVGKMTHTIGWEWTFGLIAIFSLALLPLIIFYCPETTYPRPEHKTLEGDLNRLREHYEGIRTSTSQQPETESKEKFHTPVGSSANSTTEAITTGARSPPRYDDVVHIPQKISYARSLLPFSRRFTTDNPFKLVLRPFPLFLHPAIFWACLIQGAMIGWTVMMGVVLAAIFLGPPLWFDEVITGYMYTGPFLGAVVGFFISGIFSELSTKWLIRKNNGIYEPEFRLLLVIPQLIFGAVGLYGFGWAGSNVSPGGYVLPDFFFALEVIAMINGAVASSLYIVDAYRDLQVEAFTCLLIFKNVFSFGLTWSAYDWLLAAGRLYGKNNIYRIFLALGSVQVGICLLTIPLWIFGKKLRFFFSKFDYLKAWGLK